MLSPLMPNANELLGGHAPWVFDEEEAADLALLHSIGVLGSMREQELVLFFRGELERDSDTPGDAEQFSVIYPARSGSGNVKSESAAHTTRRRLLNLVEAGQLCQATLERTTPENLAGRYYWLSGKGSRRLLGCGYQVRGRQSIDNMSHAGSVQDQHRLLEQQYLIARRLINPSLRIWGEYAIRSGLAKRPVPAARGTKVPTVREQLVDMSGELYLTPKELGDSRKPDTVPNRRHFTRRPDALVLDEQSERNRYWDAVRIRSESKPAHFFGDIEWVEIEASKKDAVTQARSFNGIFYLGRLLDATLERGLVTRFMLVTRNHPHTDLRGKLLSAYEHWLARSDVQAMLRKNSVLTRGFDLNRLNERLWVAELTQDSEQRLTGLRLESIASISLHQRQRSGLNAL